MALILAVAAAAFGVGVEKQLKSVGFDDPATESVQARGTMRDGLGYDAAPGIVALVTADDDVRSARNRHRIHRLARRFGDDHAVAKVVTPYGPGGDRLISRNGKQAALPIHLRSDDDDLARSTVSRLGKRADTAGLHVKLGGFAPASGDIADTVRDDVARAEAIAFPILAILLVIVFRGLVAASIPLLIGAFAVLGSFVALRLLNGPLGISVLSMNVTTALGLGLAVDYGLLLVSRYREELERHGPGERALHATIATAGRTVLFSGLTVAVAMASLLLMPQRLLYSLGAGGATVALLSSMAALLIVPPLLALLGPRINALSIGRRRSATDGGRDGGWARLARFVLRRPIPVAVASAAVLVAAGLPFLGATWTFVDSKVPPRSFESRQVGEALDRDFGRNPETPISVAVSTPGREIGARQVATLAKRIARLDGLDGQVAARRVSPNLAVLTAYSRHAPLDRRSEALVNRIRDLPSPARVQVAGQTAAFIDLKASIVHHLPIVLATITISTLILLFLMTGSLILPIKTLIMNLLTICAALGAVVVGFQHGVLGGAVGFDGPNAVEVTLGVFLLAVTFGLSTDYAVMLLSRIQEEHRRGATSDDAIAVGMQRTGRIITAAAVLLVVVFLAFASSSIFFIKEMSVGQAFAVAVDATIVRALLVPSLMRLMGRWNWWAPAPLQRLHRWMGMAEGDSSRVSGGREVSGRPLRP